MRKLKKGKEVVANGRTYDKSVPESVIKSLNLSDDIFEQVATKHEKQHKRHEKP